VDYAGLVKSLHLPAGFTPPRQLLDDDIRAIAISRADLDDDVRGMSPVTSTTGTSAAATCIRWAAEPP
jgi:hypothetical protein